MICKKYKIKIKNNNSLDFIQYLKDIKLLFFNKYFNIHKKFLRVKRNRKDVIVNKYFNSKLRDFKSQRIFVFDRIHNKPKNWKLTKNLKKKKKGNLFNKQYLYYNIYKNDSNCIYQHIMASYCPVINDYGFQSGYSHEYFKWKLLKNVYKHPFENNIKTKRFNFKDKFFWVMGKVNNISFIDRLLGFSCLAVDTGLGTVYTIDKLIFNKSYNLFIKNVSSIIVLGIYSFKNLLGYINSLFTNKIFYTITMMVCRSVGLYNKSFLDLYKLLLNSQEKEIDDKIYNYFILSSAYNLYYWNFLSYNYDIKFGKLFNKNNNIYKYYYSLNIKLVHMIYIFDYSIIYNYTNILYLYYYLSSLSGLKRYKIFFNKKPMLLNFFNIFNFNFKKLKLKKKENIKLKHKLKVKKVK